MWGNSRPPDASPRAAHAFWSVVANRMQGLRAAKPLPVLLIGGKGALPELQVSPELICGRKVSARGRKRASSQAHSCHSGHSCHSCHSGSRLRHAAGGRAEGHTEGGRYVSQGVQPQPA